MKTAVSLPDDLFQQAEAAARQLGVSRSEFYAKALAAFLHAQSRSNVTARLNAVYSEVPSELDTSMMAAQLKSIPREDW